jgi:hypothetical protein
MDLEAQTDVNLLLEYCQLSSSDIVKNIIDSNNILQPNSNDIIHDKKSIIIKKQVVKAGLDSSKFPLLLLALAIGYLLYKNYKK